MLLRALATVALAAGCATENPVALDTRPNYVYADRAVEGRDYVLTIAENSEAQRFDLVLQSRADRPLCIEIEGWPNRGAMHYAMEYVFVEAEGRRYPIALANFGYCIGGCGTHFVQPHSALAGYINYDQFSPDAFASEVRRLVMSPPLPPVHFCSLGAPQ